MLFLGISQIRPGDGDAWYIPDSFYVPHAQGFFSTPSELLPSQWESPPSLWKICLLTEGDSPGLLAPLSDEQEPPAWDMNLGNDTLVPYQWNRSRKIYTLPGGCESPEQPSKGGVVCASQADG